MTKLLTVIISCFNIVIYGNLSSKYYVCVTHTAYYYFKDNILL